MKVIDIIVPPTGNHRIGEQGTAYLPKEGGKGNVRCPKCAAWLLVGTRKYRKKDYETWIEAVALQLKVGFRKVEPPVRIWLYLYAGKGVKVQTKTGFKLTELIQDRQDIDNIQKCVGDALKESGIIPDDSVQYIRSWRIEYFDREEHLAKLGPSRPRNKADLKARVLIGVEPLNRTEGNP